MDAIPRVKHTLSAEEKLMIVRSHAYFMKEKRERRGGTDRKVRNRVAECLGVATSTVASVIAEWNKRRDQSLVDNGGCRGRPPLSYDQSLIPLLREIIETRHAKELPVTSKIVVSCVQERTGILYNDRTIRRALKRNGYRFTKDKKWTCEPPSTLELQEAMHHQEQQQQQRQQDPNGDQILSPSDGQQQNSQVVGTIGSASVVLSQHGALAHVQDHQQHGAGSPSAVGTHPGSVLPDLKDDGTLKLTLPSDEDGTNNISV